MGLFGAVLACWAVVMTFLPGCIETATSSLGVRVFTDEPSRLELSPEALSAAASGPRRARVDLFAAINETLGFLLVLHPMKEPLEQPEFQLEPLHSYEDVIAPAAYRVYRVHRVEATDWPGWHLRAVQPTRREPAPLDVLVPVNAPRGGMPTTLLPNETYIFWVDLSIPKGVAAGVYGGDIVLTSSGRPAGTVTVELTVLPFVLPSDDPIPFVVELDHRSLFRHHIRWQGRSFEVNLDGWQDSPLRDELDGLLASTMRMLRAHRVSPVLPDLSPVIKVNAGGETAVDWSKYDAAVDPYLSGKAFFDRVPVVAWPLPVDRILEPMTRGGTLPSPGAARLLGQYFAECLAHFEERGWFDRCFAPIRLDDVAFGESLTRASRLAALFKSASERIRVAAPLFPQDMAPYGWVDFPLTDESPDVDIWMPAAQFFDRDAMAAQRAAGKDTWLSVDRPPYSGTTSIYARPGDVRSLCWQVLQLGAQALHGGCVNHWPTSAIGATPEQCVAADPHVLLYPGAAFGLPEPVPSLRLKRVRRTMQDLALARLLDLYGMGHIREALQRALVPYCGTDAYSTHFADGRPSSWPDSREWFDEARDIMARALQRKAEEPGEEPRMTGFPQSARWRRFMLSTRVLEAGAEAVRVYRIVGAVRPELGVDCVISLMNRKRVAVSGNIGFAALPAGWHSVDPERAFGPIPPGASQRVTLTAQTDMIVTDAAGVLNLPLVLRTGDGQERKLGARLALATAVPAAHPISIDGDTSEWPIGVANVMSDFVLITGVSEDSGGLELSRPQAPASAFILRDGASLCLAVICQDDRARESDAVRRNWIRYDDLIPVGEELIEVLIDPLGAGTRSPSDLYHIVVKRNGSYLTERGIATEPPCSINEPWAAQVEVATRMLPGRWIAEIRIPLSSFEDAAASGVWGLNVTRYDVARRAYATWSGAIRNAYDPLSLGNLLLP
jgi:hypothetical protein